MHLTIAPHEPEDEGSKQSELSEDVFFCLADVFLDFVLQEINFLKQ